MRQLLLLACCFASFLPAQAAEGSGSDEKKAKAGLQQALEAFSKGDFKKARAAFAKLVEQKPDEPVYQLNLGTAEFRLGNHDAAKSALEKAVRLDPANAPAWLTLGVVRIEMEDLDGALAALSQAVWLDRRNARAHAYLGVVVGRKGWLSAAEQELQKAIELEPENAEAHFNLALFYLQRNPPALELARRHYQRAVSLGAAPDELVEKQLAK